MKFDGIEFAELREFVAPHAGAWIEIQGSASHELIKFVAPHAGAWIEISGESFAYEGK